MILVDTSVWVNHFKDRNEDVVRLLLSDSTLIHPPVIAELAERFDLAYQASPSAN